VRNACSFALTAILLGFAPGPAAAQGYNGYPYSIMAPEPGTATRHIAAPGRTRHDMGHAVKPLVGRSRHWHGLAARGSSGSVLLTPLPRTELIPAEGGGRLTVPALPREQGPSVVPGVASPVPNLPHGTETFQDRASRCAFQSGLYNVPGTARSQYMGGCVQ